MYVCKIVILIQQRLVLHKTFTVKKKALLRQDKILVPSSHSEVLITKQISRIPVCISTILWAAEGPDFRDI